MKVLTVMVIFTVLIGGLYIPAKAQFGQAIWDTLTADTLQEAISSQALSVNGYEQFHLAYAKRHVGTRFAVCYRYFDLFNGAYPEVIAEAGRDCSVPVIASRFNDNYSDIAILYESENDIYTGVVNGPFEQWHFENVTNSSDPDFSPSVAYGANYLHGAWITLTSRGFKIAYMKRIGDSTGTEIIEASELGEFGSGAAPFIIAPLDVPHIFYRGVNGPYYKIHHAYKVSPDSDWTIEYLYTDNADDYTASATCDDAGNIHLAISGNGGFGFPGRVYYTWRDHDTGAWSRYQLVTGSYSAVNGSIMTKTGGKVFIASCGTNGNIFDGHVYLSNDTSGTFQTQLLCTYQSVTQLAIANVINQYGVLVFDAAIGADQTGNIELVYYGPHLSPTSIKEPIPVSPALSYCYPNPFNSQTSIAFTLDQPTDVTIDAFDITGRRVAQIFSGYIGVGSHHATWDAAAMGSGVYFYKIQAGNDSEIKKITLLK